VLFVVAGLATSWAWALPALVVARLLAGFPPMTDEVVQPGMLADLYEEHEQPRVFAVLRGTVTLSGVSAAVLGAIAASAGWRAAFLFTAVLGAVVLIPAWRLQEPVAAAPLLRASDAEPSGLVRPRWLWVTAFFYGACTIPFNQMQSLFFEDVYGTGPFGRGVLIAVATGGTLIGLAIGTPLAERDDRRQGTPGLITAMTRALTLFAGFVALIGLAPVMLLSGIAVLGASIGGGMLLVAFYPLINRSSPAGKRSRTFALVTFTAGLGAIASTPLFTIGDNIGYRTTTFAVAGLSAVMAFASSMLRRDQVRYAEAAPAVRL
jgi:MFS family permease